jgi:hypothetical protein
MKTIKCFTATLVLTLCLAGSVFAGDIPAPGSPAPQPTISGAAVPQNDSATEPTILEVINSGVIGFINVALLVIL